MLRATRRMIRWVSAGGAALTAAGLLAGCGGGSSATPQPMPTSPLGAGSQVRLHFRVQVAGKAASSDKIAFFGEYRAVPAGWARQSAPVPAPASGTGYVTVRLTGTEGDGVYTASQHLDPGRYAVAIFAGHGVRHSGAGAYPAPPVTRVAGTGASVDLTRDRTISGVYRGSPADRSSSAAPPSSAPSSAPATTRRHRHG
jgi:hypothetical protein